MVGTILSMLGYDLSEKMLQDIIKEVDEDGEWKATTFFHHFRRESHWVFVQLCYYLLLRAWHFMHIFLLSTGSGELEFEEFCTLAARFLVEEDTEALQQELREAFRLYDKEGNGYITTDVFRGILHELDDKLSPEELDLMIEEIDADGSGTLDFDGISFHGVSYFFLALHNTDYSLIPRKEI